CDDSRCLPPRTLELTAATSAIVPGAAGIPPGDQVARWVGEWGWALTFVWVALLGVALNLTPCVYPLISVTVAFFGGRTAREHPPAGRPALLYVLRICLRFSTLRVAAAPTGPVFRAPPPPPPAPPAVAV